MSVLGWNSWVGIGMESKKIIDFLVKKKQEGMDISYWKVTEKNIVIYDLNDKRTLISLSEVK